MDLDFSKLDALYSRQARAKRETEPPLGEAVPPPPGGGGIAGAGIYARRRR